MIPIETLLCIGMLLLTCSQNPPANLLTREDQGKLIPCQVHQEFVVALESNPTTGFSWQLSKGDNPHIKLLREEFIPNDPKRLGAPGKQLFHFQAMAIGQAPLIMEYRRAWERDAEPAKIFSVTLVVSN
ncbi:MAG TPA: protease inhibitor I42 family protein [bacterium]|nr:protease inhibitor I42 family protein [bacterium]HQG44233.1 protease inhibitor I42 family protein [bacterium]HQI48017.1 protease inhibitor I42 family protein [bacterium]HQJ63602.1 protease inhibitor I42 family protein [bacterium]